ncbi:MAG: tetratricopeptide repeat protein [Magnetococcales bacterium]|nr:tetratricopeptide repeat protein [Magnetococcales bacterium]
MHEEQTSQPSTQSQPQITLNEAYTQAVEHFNAERYSQAEQICHSIIQAEENHIFTINLLGVIAQKVNRHDLAITYFQKAIKLDDSQALFYYNIGISLHNLARDEEAIKFLDNALKLQPDNIDIADYLNTVLNHRDAGLQVNNKQNDVQNIFLKGIDFHKSGKLKEAINCYRDILAIQPNSGAAYFNLGVAYKSLGKLDEAINNFGQATKNGPDNPQAHYNLGVTLQEKGSIDAATASFLKAIEIKPDYVEAYNDLGNIFKVQKELDKAVDMYQKAIAMDPDYANSYCNLGVVLLDQDNIDGAVAMFNKALDINPNFIEAYNNLGTAFNKQEKYTEAIASFQKAIAIKPDYTHAYYNLGTAFHAQGNLNEAVEQYKTAISQNPDFFHVYNSFGLILKDQAKFEDATAMFKKALLIKPDYIAAHENLIFCLDLYTDVESEQCQTERNTWNRLHAEPLKKYWKPFANVVDQTRKLNIGYVGADFKRHSAANIFGSILLNCDLNNFNIFCYVGNDKEDDLSDHFKKVSTGWISTSKMDDGQLAEKIRSDGIDILVDLSGYTKGNRLLAFARKPAPIQISAWGYPLGTQMDAMDYIFADPIAIPLKNREKYQEKIVDLSCIIHLNTVASYPETVDPPAITNGYITFGSFNRIAKYNNNVFKVWVEILRRIPDSKLIFKIDVLTNSKNSNNIETFFLDHGIAKDRVIFMGHNSKLEHIKAHNLIDIMLDPFPHNGGVTTLDSLRMGVPVLTCEDKTLCPISASILHVIGLDEWRTKDEEEYIEKAVHFAKEIQYLKTLRHQLQPQFDKSALGNPKLYTQEVEAIYRQLWQKWCQKESKPS